MNRKVAHLCLTLVIMAAGAVYFSGCDNSDQLGLEITPPGERFQYKIDSSTRLTAVTLRQDSLSSERRASVLLGSMNDPVFGRTQASFMTQLRLSTNKVDFGENVVLDSVQLLLKYKSAYGDTLQLQKMRVYELTQPLYYDSAYYSNLNPEGWYDEANPAGALDFYPTPGADSLLVTLNEWVGYKILQADTSHLADNTAFLEFVNGLYVTTEAADASGSISYFNLSGGKSRMIIYYHNEAEDSLSYEVLINSNCTWVGLFDHDYVGAEVAPLINDSSAYNDLLYLQTMAGLRGHLNFEFNDSLLAVVDGGVAINKAELVLPVDPATGSDLYKVPPALRVFGVNSDGTNSFIGDILLGDEYHGGYYNSDRNAYFFNVTVFIQNLLHPDPAFRADNTGLFLTINDDRITANRVALLNGRHPEGMHLIITYTIIR